MARMQSDESYDGTPATQINAIVTHPTLPLLVSAHEDKFIRFFDISSGEQTYVLPAHSDAVTSLAISPLVPNTLVSGGHDSSLRIWDLDTKTFVQEITLHRRNKDQGVLAVSMHPKRKVLASAGADGIVKLLTWVEGRA
ncbi:striatin-3-like protein [Mrakia frigida]|uniref:striatin-3-like protein n=1 Tax=Mrakia frigida TaxID=29902 RepID=UPI003FCBF0B4